MTGRLAFLSSLFLVATTTRAAGTTQGTATGAASARAEFMTMAVGARAASMGEAFTAVADDASAVTLNPGGLGQSRTPGAMAMYDSLGAGAGVGLLAASWPIGPVTAGIGLALLQFGDYDVRDAAGTKLGTEQVTDYAATAAVAFANPGGLPGWSGVSVEGVRETAGDLVLAGGLGGVVPVGEDIRLGWAAAHLGPASGGFGPPAIVRAGGTWLTTPSLRVSAEGGFTLADKQPLAAAGVEFLPVTVAAIRAGYRWIGNAAPPGLTGVTAGAGIRLGSFGLDYAYQPFGDLATTHRLAVVYTGRAHEDAPAAVEPAPVRPAPVVKPAQKKKKVARKTQE